MTQRTPSETHSADLNRAAHLGRVTERSDRIQALWALLAETNKETVLAALSEGGYKFEEGFENKDLPAIQEAIREAIAQMQEMNNEVPGLATAIKQNLVGASKTALKTGPEVMAEDPRLAKFKADFDRGLRLIKADRTVEAKPVDLTWEKVVARLNEQNTVNPEKTNLEMAEAMQGGGELIGVDENGKLLIKDRGNEPVMFGVNKDGQTIMIYDRKPEEMAKVSQWANYWKVYEAVYGAEGKPTGYELFPDAPDYEKNGAIAAVEEVNKAPFVKSANGKEWRASWLDNGRSPDNNAYARRVFFIPVNREAVVDVDRPHIGGDDLGAVRLLRV